MRAFQTKQNVTYILGNLVLKYHSCLIFIAISNPFKIQEEMTSVVECIENNAAVSLVDISKSLININEWIPSAISTFYRNGPHDPQPVDCTGASGDNTLLRGIWGRCQKVQRSVFMDRESIDDFTLKSNWYRQRINVLEPLDFVVMNSQMAIGCDIS